MRFTVTELDSRWHEFDRQRSPRRTATVTQICVRPSLNERAFPERLELSPVRGAIGDRWERRTWMYLPDGSPDPRVQLAFMDTRMLQFLQELTGSMHHPGDTLLIDLDLSEGAIPTDTLLQVGTASIQVSNVENDGCGKFAKHYGDDVLAWIRAPENRARRLRGAFARVVNAGSVRAGDSVNVCLA